MFEIIACPECNRRLQLPADSEIDLVCCPSCGSEFPANSVPRLVASGIAPTPAATPRRLPPPEPRTPRRPLDYRDRPPQRSSWAPWIIAFSLVGAAVLLLAVGAVGLALLGRASRRTPPPYAYAKMPQPTVPVPLAKATPVPANELIPELKPLFADLGAGLRASDRQRIMSHFDIERMADEFSALTNVPLRNGAERGNFVSTLNVDLASILTKQVAPLQWSTFQIRWVVKLDEREVIALICHTNAKGVTMKRRWWLTRRSGTWKIYDMENINVSMRYSLATGCYSGEKIPRLVLVCQSLRTMRDTLNTLVLQQPLNDPPGKLRALAGLVLPPQLEGLRYLVIARVQLELGAYQQAVTACDRAQLLQPDMPGLNYLHGLALNGVGQWEEALKRLQAYRGLVGDSAQVWTDIGLSQRGLKHFADAASAYRQALDLNPKYATAYFGLLKSLYYYDKHDDLGPRFDKLDDRRANFDVFAEDLEKRDYLVLLEPILASMNKTDPDYVSVSYYTALSKARAGQSKLAVPLFKAAMRRQPDANKRKGYVTGFLHAMTVGGQYTDAYAVAPNPREAFRILAAAATKSYQTEKLRDLVAVHAKTNAADPLLPWYQAEVYAQDERFPLAEKTFATALAQPPDEATLKSFRASRVLTRYRLGQTLAAYREIGPRPETFIQLANLCFFDHNDAQLQALLDAHAANDPEDIQLFHYGFRLKIRQNRIDEGVALFKTALTKHPTDAVRRQLVSEFLSDIVTAGKFLEGYRAAPDAADAFVSIASQLLRLERLEDLRQLIEVHRAGHPDDPWLAYYEGERFVHNKDWDKATQIFKVGMRKAPKNVRESYRWRYEFAMCNAGHSLQVYEESQQRAQTFSYLANLLIADKKAVELEALLKAHQPNAKDDPEFLFCEARAKVLAKQPVAAAGLLAIACQKQKFEGRRRAYVSRVVLELDAAGLGMEGYRAVGEKTFAFEALALRWVSQKKDKELAILLKEHGKNHAGEVLYQFYRGELHMLRGEGVAAEQDFAACLAKATPAQQWRFRNALFRARIKAGRVVATYQENQPGTATFENLASLCLQEKDGKQLAALLDAYRQLRPDDPNVISYQADVYWLNHDYDGVLKLLDEHHDDVFRRSSFRWKSENYRVRCLVKLKKTEDAIREVERQAKNPYPNTVLLVLAHAATGDVKQTIAVTEKQRPQPYVLRSYYQDEDLGPLLKSEPFRAFREKFPEPKDDPVLDDDYDDPE